MLQLLLKRRKMLCLINRTLTDDHMCFSIQNRAHKTLDIRSAILVVRISVNNNVCTITKTCIKPCHKSLGKSLVAAESYDIMHAPLLSYFSCIIRTSIINYEIFYLIYAINVFWQIIKCYLKCLSLVVTWYLYNKFHYDLYPLVCMRYMYAYVSRL